MPIARSFVLAIGMVLAGCDALKLPDFFQASPKPGDTFRDCPECPEMVVLPEGSFTMGAAAEEKGRSRFEGPSRKVVIPRPFAAGRFEITFEEWDACTAVDCPRNLSSDQSWGRGRRPVINIGWSEAQEYVKWLQGRTGKRYRLLSEAEWEYAARGGTPTPWSCGGDEGCLRGAAWFAGNAAGKTQPVGGKTANGFGLHDMHGNAGEWVEDCWHDGYRDAPSDGSAWMTGGDCPRHVIRGGHWGSGPGGLRSAARVGERGWSAHIGFRVARALD